MAGSQPEITFVKPAQERPGGVFIPVAVDETTVSTGMPAVA